MTIYEQIYDAYPRKDARTLAIQVIKRKVKQAKVDPEHVLERVQEYAKVVQDRGVERQFTPMCSTFFNQFRWEEDYNDRHPPRPEDQPKPEIDRKLNLL